MISSTDDKKSLIEVSLLMFFTYLPLSSLRDSKMSSTNFFPYLMLLTWTWLNILLFYEEFLWIFSKEHANNLTKLTYVYHTCLAKTPDP